MARPARRDYEFHIDQETLYEEIEIFSPLSKKQELFLNDNDNDIIIWGGAASSGKSHVSLLKLMIDCIDYPNYNSLLLRESLSQMKMPGGLWQEGTRMFSKAADVKSNGQSHEWKFPNGSYVKMHYLKDNENDIQGSQLHSAIIEEAAQIKSMEEIWYITSRLRGSGPKRKQMRLTCNPDKNSPLCGILTAGNYLDDEGYPDPAMDGKRTYLIQIAGEYEVYQSRKEIKEKYGDTAAKAAYRLVFYSATIRDNPRVLKEQPEYLFKLQQMKTIHRKQLLEGNWFAASSGVGYFKREDVKEIDKNDVPLGLPTVRAWDLAATKPDPTASKKSKLADPDWTRGVKCAYDKETNNFYIIDMKSIRDRAALVDNLIYNTAAEDGNQVYPLIPQDPGAAGKSVAEAKRTKLLHLGYKPMVVQARKSKLERAQNFLIAAQQGDVYIVKGTFTDDHYLELENFTGERKSAFHDDIMDALSDAYETLVFGKMVPVIRVARDNPRLNNMFGRTLL